MFNHAVNPRQPLVASLEPVELWNRNGWPVVDVMGETYHEPQIRRILGRVGPQGVDRELLARLVPEPRNPHDPHAVAVFVGQDCIGYLARELAWRYQPMLLGLASVGKEATTPGRIYANESQDWEHPGRKVLFAQVRITLDEPWMCLPANGFPSHPYAFLEHGSALQLQKETEHMAVLTRYIGENGERWVVGTLHRAEPANAKKPIVEVRVDGGVIGELTPAMSEHYLPTIDAAVKASRVLAAKVMLKGNPLKIEGVLYAQKAHEISVEWIAANLPPSAPPAAPAPKPALLFNSPPGWPTPPPGWTPPNGWRPPADWPPAPPGWEFWIPAAD